MLDVILHILQKNNYPQIVKHSTIFKTYENDLDGISNKIGFSKRSFAEWGSQVATSFKESEGAIGKFKNTLVTMFTVQKDIEDKWYKNDLGEIITKDNIDSYIPKITTDDARYQLVGLQNIQNEINATMGSWDDYADRFKKNEKYLLDYARSHNVLESSVDDLKVANKNARQAAIAHNNALKQQTLGAKATTLALKALSIAGNMIAMWAISEVITGLYKLSQVSKDVAASASEMGSSFSSTKSDIKDYKQEVEELYETINDSSSSISEVTDARKQLMSVQDELIEKYGTEQSSIDAITKAVKGETNAWKELTETKWQELKNEFNDGGFINDVGNFFSGYEDNLERMQKEYGEYEVEIKFDSLTSDNRKIAKELFKDFGEWTDIYSKGQYGVGQGSLKLSGNATEVYSQLLKIQGLVDKFGIDFGNSFDSQLRNLANAAKETSTQYKDLYNQFVLNEKILKDTEDGYSDSFKKITEEYDKYQDAVNSNDGEKVKASTESFVKAVTEEMDKAFTNGDSDVADYFRNMYPELQDEIDSWNFDVKFEANTDNLKDDVSGSLEKMGGLSKEELLGLNLKTATDEQRQGYGELQAIAEEYNLTINELIDKLEVLGLISSESYQNLVDKFGQDAVDNLTPEELQIALTISTEEADKAIEEEKKKVETELKSLGKEGNVDLTIRPVIDSSAMQAAGWDVEDGSIATTFTQGEFIWQGDEENGQYVYVHYTPILPDGTVLTPEELTDYLHGTLESSEDILGSDDKGLVLKVDTDLNIPEDDIKKFQNGEGSTQAIDDLIQKTGEWDDKVHSVQEQYYDTGDGIGYVETALDGLIAKHSELENFNEMTTSFRELEKINEEIDNIQKSYQSVQSAFEEYVETGVFSVDSFQALMEISPKHLQYLMDEKGQLNLNTEALNEYTNSLIDEAAQRQINTIIDYVAKLDSEAQAQYFLKTATDKSSESLETFATNLLKAKIAAGELSAETAQNLATMLNGVVSWANKAKEGVRKNGLSSSTKDTEKTIKDIHEQLEDLDKKEKLDNLKNTISEVDLYLSSMKDTLDSIGKSGSTGKSTGAHLHYEIRTPNGGRLHPDTYLAQRAKSKMRWLRLRSEKLYQLANPHQRTR